MDVRKRLLPAHRLVSSDPSVCVYICVVYVCVYVMPTNFHSFRGTCSSCTHTQRKPQRLQRKFLVLKAKSSTGLLGMNAQCCVGKPIEQINGGEINQSFTGSYRIYGLFTPLHKLHALGTLPAHLFASLHHPPVTLWLFKWRYTYEC